MEKDNKIVKYVILPIIIFLFAYFLRRYFFCGFILGDDLEEFHLIRCITLSGPTFFGHLQYRFGLWLFNVIFFKLFGISETTFFLPTWLMSSSLSVIGYYILISKQYKSIYAFPACLFVASAPFEVLIGTVRANDLILSWVLALGLLFFILFEKRYILQGFFLALTLWIAFYVKLWAVYLFPALCIYYLIQILRKKNWHGLISFSATSLLLHCTTFVFWKIKTCYFFPFLTAHSATYPVATNYLDTLFMQYPKMIFQGSQFGTTLFGFIPYLLILFLGIKIVLIKKYPKHYRLDNLDLYLFVYYSSFFVLLNFFPNSFKFDQYYSAPRIFRYLAPISFPMSLHLAKLIIDICKINFKSMFIRKYLLRSLFVFLIFINIYQANEATKPGQIYRKALLSVIKDIKQHDPQQIIVDGFIGFFLKEVYLKEKNMKILFPQGKSSYNVNNHEIWLRKHQASFPEGTILISGLNYYVHYGPHYNGFRINQFKNKLDKNWKLFKEYDLLSYLPIPEPARLWKLSYSKE